MRAANGSIFRLCSLLHGSTVIYFVFEPNAAMRM